MPIKPKGPYPENLIQWLQREFPALHRQADKKLHVRILSADEPMGGVASYGRIGGGDIAVPNPEELVHEGWRQETGRGAQGDTAPRFLLERLLEKLYERKNRKMYDSDYAFAPFDNIHRDTIRARYEGIGKPIGSPDGTVSFSSLHRALPDEIISEDNDAITKLVLNMMKRRMRRTGETERTPMTEWANEQVKPENFVRTYRPLPKRKSIGDDLDD